MKNSNNRGSGKLVTILGIVLFVLFVCLVHLLGYKDGYKQGQIAAISGNVKYELKVNPDKSTSWVPRRLEKEKKVREWLDEN